MESGDPTANAKYPQRLASRSPTTIPLSHFASFRGVILQAGRFTESAKGSILDEALMYESAPY